MFVAIDAVPADFGSSRAAAVAQIYRDACTDGVLKVGARGSINKKSHVPSLIIDWRLAALPVEKATYVTFRDPPSTSVVIRSYKANSGSKIASDCMVITRAVGIKEALTHFLKNSADVLPVQKWDHGTYESEWTYDFKGKGYQQTLLRRSPDWVIFHTRIFRQQSEISGR